MDLDKLAELFNFLFTGSLKENGVLLWQTIISLVQSVVENVMGYFGN